MLMLYHSPGSSSMAVHIALHEIGVPFESKVIALAGKENRAPGYLAINPEGKVPTLLADGRPLTEVAAILYWLARRYPEAGLWPEGDLAAEAEVISWMSFIAATIHPARRQGPERSREVFELAEQRLARREWLLPRYSVADIHLFRLYWRYVGWAHPAPGTLPGLAAHYERMMARPAVRRTCEIEAAIGYALPV
jgi:glutathione S-transferase